MAKRNKHWYFIDIYTCPLCGTGSEIRERRYTERPRNWTDRHKEHDSVCEHHFIGE